MGAHLSWLPILCFFMFWGATSKIAVLLAWELNSGELDRHLSVFFYLEMLKSQVFTCLSFSCFFIMFGLFWRPWGLFWHPFGASVVSFGVLVSSSWVPSARLGCLWALSAAFCGAFGSSGLSVGSGTAPGLFVASFLVHFGIIFGGTRGWNLKVF